MCLLGVFFCGFGVFFCFSCVSAIFFGSFFSKAYHTETVNFRSGYRYVAAWRDAIPRCPDVVFCFCFFGPIQIAVPSPVVRHPRPHVCVETRRRAALNPDLQMHNVVPQSGNSRFCSFPRRKTIRARQSKPRGTRPNPGVAPQNPVFFAKKTGFALKKAITKKRFRANAQSTIRRAQKKSIPTPPPRGMKPGKFLLCGAMVAGFCRFHAGRPAWEMRHLFALGRSEEEIVRCCETPVLQNPKNGATIVHVGEWSETRGKYEKSPAVGSLLANTQYAAALRAVSGVDLARLRRILFAPGRIEAGTARRVGYPTSAA